MRSRIPLLLSCSALLAVAVAQLWPGLSAGLSPPISWDHGSHLGKAMLTAELLPSIRGWSDRIETGLPLNTLYTASGPLWVLLFRLFTPFLEWHQTYALSIVGFRFMVGFTVYRLARVAGAGPLAATLAGIATLADIGDHSEGGWFYDVLYGVWPMSLAMCFFFLAYADLIELAEAKVPLPQLKRLMARAMVLLGIALFSHQMSLVSFGLLLPVLVAVRATSRTGSRAEGSVREDLKRTLPVALVASLIAAWWMVPMLAESGWLENHGQLYQGTENMGARIVGGEGILNGGAWTGVLFAIGLGLGLMGRPTRKVLAIGVIVAMLVSSSGWFVAFDVPRYLPAFGRIMYPRLMMVAKPMGFALLGCVLHDLFMRVRPALKAQLRTGPGRLGAALSIALVIPFVPGIPAQLNELVFEREVTTTATLGTWNDWRAAWRWVEERPDSSPFYRVGYFSLSTHLPQATVGYTRRPMHITGTLVGETFRNKTDSSHPDALRAINVRYVITEGPATGELARELDPIESFGVLRLYELRGWSSDVVSAPLGEATPIVEHYEDERVVFRPEGARSVVIHRAIGPGWTATADGVAIPFEEERVYDSPALTLMRLELPEGVERVEIRYHGFRGSFVFGWLLTLLGLLVVGLLAGGWDRLPETRRAALLSRVDTMRARVTERVPPAARDRIHAWWPAVVCLAPFLAVGLLAMRGARGTHLTLTPHTVSVESESGNTACTGDGTRHLCPDGTTIERIHVAVDGWYHSCLSARPVRGGDLVMTWHDVAMSGALHLTAGVDDQAFLRTGEPIEVEVTIDESDPVLMRVPLSHELITEDVSLPEGERHDVRIVVRSHSTDRRWLCLDAIAR